MKFTEYMNIRNSSNKKIKNALSKIEAKIFGVEFTKGWTKRDIDLTEEQVQKAVLHVLKSKFIRMYVKENLRPLYMKENEGFDKQFLYLMKNELGMLKIGISVNPIKRARALATGSGLDVDVVCFWGLGSPAITVERMLHKKYNEFKLRGEWFKPDSFSISDIEQTFSFEYSRTDISK